MVGLNIAVCDDLREERASLTRMTQAFCRGRGLTAHIYPFSSGEELLAAMRSPGRFHIIFLDIYMPGLSGIETARRIRRLDSTVVLIFATTSIEHGMEGFEVEACDYLVKPFREEDVARSLGWCLEHWSDRLRGLSVYAEGEWMDLPLPSIVYIEVLDHQSHIHTQRRVVITRRGLDDLSGDVDNGDFLRCHRSFLVNMDHVQGIEGPNFRMDDGSLVPISTGNLSKIRNQFIDWTYKKAWSRK